MSYELSTINSILSRRDTLSITPYKRRRSVVWGVTAISMPARGAGVGIQDA